MTEWTGENRRQIRHWTHRVERTLVRWRILSIIVMIWSGWVMSKLTFHVIDLFKSSSDLIQLAAVLGALGVGLAPFLGIFKLAFDFALDGKIDKD